MIIAIDYDDTYTRDPVSWNKVCHVFIEAGHDVWCVSARSQAHMDDPEQTIGFVIGSDKCVGTNGQPKRNFMYKEKDVLVDVWVDDAPESITWQPLLKGLSTDYGDFSDMEPQKGESK